MNHVSQRLLLGGLLVLTVGMLLPWVTLNDHSERGRNLRQVADISSLDWLPESVRQQMIERNLKPGTTPEDVWRSLAVGQEGRYADYVVFAQLAQRLFWWDMLRLKSSGFTQLLIMFLLLVNLAGWTVFLQCRQSRPAKVTSSDEDLSLWNFDHEPVQSRSGRNWAGFLSMVVVVVLFGFIWQMPFFDTLGYRGNWTVGLLDIIVGARVAFAPRLLIPLGLIFIALAGVESILEHRYRSNSTSDDEELS